MLVDLETLARAELALEPFRYTVVPDFIRPADARAILEDFPAIADPGLLPLEATTYGHRFGALIRELQSAEVARAFSEKFDIDLAGRPTMITVRGRCQEKDGRIHPDSEAKLVTALLYFNEHWESSGGRLRLLRSATDLNDVIAEVPPTIGTLVAFRRSDCSFHGHEKFVGVRRYVMINWMANGFAAQKELVRHRISAQVKRLFPASAGAAHA
jgi:hypothetical protein